jgi:hypothetical protein
MDTDGKGYTSEWTSDEEDQVYTCLIETLDTLSKADFEFCNAVPEQAVELNDKASQAYLVQGQPGTNGPKETLPPTAEALVPTELKTHREDHALGETSVPLTLEWINKQIRWVEEEAKRDRTGDNRVPPPYSDINGADPDKAKTVVAPTDYTKVEVEPGKHFYIGVTIQEVELQLYQELLKEYSDGFAWSAKDLTGILPKFGEHHIELEENPRPVCQRQYWLNPKYSLMVKEDIDKLLEAGFIYPVNNTEWVSPIVVVPKKKGPDGTVKIRVCQDYRKLNAATKKDYYPLPFMDMILDHVAGNGFYSFLDGFSGYNQVHIRSQDQLYMTFITDWDTYTFNRIPFGLCNARECSRD